VRVVQGADLGALSDRRDLGGLLAAYAIWRFGATPRGVAACVLLWTLLALTMHRHRHAAPARRSDAAAALGGLIANLWACSRRSRRGDRRGAGYLSLWTIYWLFKLIRGKEGMGTATSSCSARSAPGSAGRCCP
jgi:leader peptidase (prepilin peptidase)/N-methyltransferase